MLFYARIAPWISFTWHLLSACILSVHLFTQSTVDSSYFKLYKLYNFVHKIINVCVCVSFSPAGHIIVHAFRVSVETIAALDHYVMTETRTFVKTAEFASKCVAIFFGRRINEEKKLNCISQWALNIISNRTTEPIETLYQSKFIFIFPWNLIATNVYYTRKNGCHSFCTILLLLKIKSRP